ncbi:hypothetical protein [Pediococcus argentinicus]|uniref:Uncharacterized protein n=1 Tax=Pediococcus argentinicus TaxID=480391 RepID=A0A0R2NMQ2_9LACO|nr:hypothetical protein [Pediococcus argentinicus]KRO25664.1 hypothetical protein IV88_GL001622 [Pediococcus argentinicus]NKZ21999.1 hypothetical protein [Pediococcus argentinicus]GEP19168.1 hypothetical protein LSA03_05520 [Pediococcus argentinicus]
MLSAIISALIALVVAYISSSNINRNKQDDQTNWVKALIYVAESSNKAMSQRKVLIVKRCLRPDKKSEKTANENYFDKFSNQAFDYCKEHQDDAEFSPEVCDRIRLIANQLLKYHWEDISFKNKNFFEKLFYFPAISERCLNSIFGISFLLNMCLLIKPAGKIDSCLISFFGQHIFITTISFTIIIAYLVHIQNLRKKAYLKNKTLDILLPDKDNNKK